MFGVLKVFPSLVDNFGLPVVFWAHGLNCLAGIAFAFFFLPETKNKTLTELSQLFVKPVKQKETSFSSSKTYKTFVNINKIMPDLEASKPQALGARPKTKAEEAGMA